MNMIEIKKAVCFSGMKVKVISSSVPQMLENDGLYSTM